MPDYKITEDDCAVYIPSGSTAKFKPLATCIGSVITPENCNGQGALAGHFMYSKVNRALVFFNRALKEFGDPENLVLYGSGGGLFSKQMYKYLKEGLPPFQIEQLPDYMHYATSHAKKIIKFMQMVRESGIPEENIHIRFSPPGSVTDFSFMPATGENKISVSLKDKNIYTGRIEDAPEPLIPEMDRLNSILKGT